MKNFFYIIIPSSIITDHANFSCLAIFGLQIKIDGKLKNKGIKSFFYTKTNSFILFRSLNNIKYLEIKLSCTISRNECLKGKQFYRFKK